MPISGFCLRCLKVTPLRLMQRYNLSNFNWKCPHCNHAVTIVDSNISYDSHTFTGGSCLGRLTLWSNIIVCPNLQCLEPTIVVKLGTSKSNGNGGNLLVESLAESQLYPSANIVQFPNYVPAPIRNDYREASLISELSPKASATLSRRCLQGIIRDYWKVKPDNLVKEIEGISDKVDSVTWGAIDSVRKIGNIGAHMEKDINTIVDVDSGEAELLLQLIETLITEWYVARHDRAERMAKITAAAASKKPISVSPQSPPST